MTQNVSRPSVAIRLAASWRLAAGLARQHPTRLRVIETHPGGGQYDCLTVIEQGKGLAESGRLDLNRDGQAHLWRRFDSPTSNPARGPDSFEVWEELVAQDDPVRLVDAVALRAGLLPPESLPASTRTSLIYRVIADFVALGIFRRERWDARSGYIDSSGSEFTTGAFRPWFDEFDGAGAKLSDGKRDPLGDPTYQFWFLLRGGEPVACLHEDSVAWRRDGTELDIYSMFEGHGRRISPVLAALVGDWLR